MYGDVPLVEVIRGDATVSVAYAVTVTMTAELCANMTRDNMQMHGELKLLLLLYCC